MKSFYALVAPIVLAGCASLTEPGRGTEIPDQLVVPAAHAAHVATGPSAPLQVARGVSNLTELDYGLSETDLVSVTPSAAVSVFAGLFTGYGNLSYMGAYAKLLTNLTVYEVSSTATIKGEEDPEEYGNGTIWAAAGTLHGESKVPTNRECGMRGVATAKGTAINYTGITISFSLGGVSGQITPTKDMVASRSKSSPDNEGQLPACDETNTSTTSGSYTSSGEGDWLICYYNDVYDLLTGAWIRREQTGCDPIYAQ